MMGRLAILAVAAVHMLDRVAPQNGRVVTAYCPDEAVDCTTQLQAALNDTMADDLLIPPRAAATGDGTWVVQPVLITFGDKVIALTTTLEARGHYFHGLHDMLVTVRGARNVSLRGGSSSKPGELRMKKQDYLATDPATGAPLYNHSEWRHALGVYDSSDVHVAHLLIAWAGGDGIYVDGLTSATIVNVHVNQSYRNAMSIISATDLVVSDCLFASESQHPRLAHLWPLPFAGCIVIGEKPVWPARTTSIGWPTEVWSAQLCH
jgi:hypothetical protein